jgi:hypothetical protein
MVSALFQKRVRVRSDVDLVNEKWGFFYITEGRTTSTGEVVSKKKASAGIVLECAFCAGRQGAAIHRSFKSEWDCNTLSQSTSTIPLVHIFTVHQITLERFDDGICVPFRPVFVFEKILYA